MAEARCAAGVEHAGALHERSGAARPRLLFLCQALPFPPDDGVQVRAYNLLRLLATEFDVTALCFYRSTARPDASDVRAASAGLTALADVSVFPIAQDRNMVRLLWDHLRSVLLRRPYTRYVYESAAFRSRLRAVRAASSFDVVHVDSLDLSAYLDLLDDLPVVCGHHNVESSLLRRRAGAEASRFRRWYLALQAGLLEREERRRCPCVALNVVVSDVDRQQLRAIAPAANVRIAANGVDTQSVRPAAGPGSGILFMGGYGWAPNREAMEFFCEAVLPLLRERRPDVTVTWIGRVPETARRAYGERYGVRVTGYVPDIAPFLEEAACCVVPLRVGGGTRVKILDAWAAGRAVVSTRIGCEGLDSRDGDNILIRDEPAAFAAAVCDVLDDVNLQLRLGRSGRATAEAVYDWERIGAELVPAYLQLARSHGVHEPNPDTRR